MRVSPTKLYLTPYLLLDTFASKVAAQNDKYADSSIGNVTGSNGIICINVINSTIL